MTASLHKLTAGDGYTYLTRQVAVTDSTQRGRSTLADYYTEKGERPGRWVGAGVAGLGSVAVGDQVTEAHMRALFGEGRHPDADHLQSAAIAAGASVDAALKGTQLGRAYPVTAGEPTPFLVQTQQRYQQYNAARGLRLNGPVPDEVRAQIRTEVGRETFEELHGRPPADRQELTSHVTRQSRRPAQAVAGFDITFTPVKSVSTLWAVAPRPVAKEIEAAHEAAVEHALAWLEHEVAHTRRGAKGVRQTEVRGVLATAFTHRDSRNGDPNLHTHVAIANKVQDRADGAWLSLDGAALYRAMVTVSEHYNSHLEAGLSERLGARFAAEDRRPDRRPVRELVGVPPGLLEAWSSRRTQIEAETAQLASRFEELRGRAPTAREMIQLAQQANLATRQAKHEPRSLAEQRDGWRAAAAAVLGSTAAVDAITTASCRLGQARPSPEATPDPAALDEAAAAVVTTVSRARARWQPTHVMAEAYRQLRDLGLPTESIDPAVQAVTARVLQGAVPLGRPDEVNVPDQLQRSDGTSVYEPKHTRLYTTTEVLEAEGRIVEHALRGAGRTVDQVTVGLALLEAEANGQPLNPGQERLVDTLARSGQRVQLAIAPAGSGKTTAMLTLARAWTDSGGTVIGLAPSAVAADELRAAVPDGTVDTLAQLAYALAPAASGAQLRLPQWAERVDDGTLVLIDEAGMAGTTELAAVIDFVVGRGGSVRLIGDDRQLAAVSAGGVLRDVQEAAGAAILTELMRFTDPAEAAATLALRDGDAAAVGFYLDRGRLHDSGDPTDTIVEAWGADAAAGRSALMIAGTRDAAAVLNEKARARRTDVGMVDGTGPSVALRSGLPAAVGDHVLTRRNDRRNRLSATDFVKNGDRWTVTGVGAGGALQVQHQRSHKITWLGADYVRQHVEHAYAVTVHSAQGSTVDVAHVLVDGSEDRQSMYVALSRGRLGNHLYLRTAGDGDPHKVLRPEVVRPSTGTEVFTAILQRDGQEESAATTRRLAASPQQLLKQHSHRYLDGVLAAAEDLAGAAQLQVIEEQAEDLVPGVTDCGGWPQLRMLLATVAVSGGDPGAELRDALAQRSLANAEDVAAVLTRRLENVDLLTVAGPLPWLLGTPEALAAHPTWGPYLAARAELVQHYAAMVSNQATMTAEPPRWAQPVHTDRRLWRELAVWRAANDIPDADLIPAGARLTPSRERNHQRRLEARVEVAGGSRASLPAQAQALLEERAPGVGHDPYWPVLARRLSAAGRHGKDLAQLLDGALDKGPLPEERPASALWFRLAGELRLTSADADADVRLRPAWTDHLLGLLPEHVGHRVLTSPDWPALVAAVHDGTTSTGSSGIELLNQAVAMVNLDDPNAGGLPVDAVAAVLAWRLGELSTAVLHDDHGDELPPDPDAAADGRPHDLDDLYRLHDRDSQPGQVDPAGAVEGTELVDPSEPVDQPAADEADAPVDADEVSGTGRARLIELNIAAAAWWAGNYPGSPAAAYMAGRLGDDLTGTPHVTVGFAPPGWSNLADHLRAGGATDAELVDAGLAKWSRRGTLIDVMRDRVVFGIRDNTGDLVGFTGRAGPGDADAPKWLNTPTTSVFTKGDLLFGLTENQDLLAAGAVPVRVEGVLDAIAVTRASHGRAVGLAPLGTALTAAQADALAQAAPQQVLLQATDNDPAGVRAAARDYWLLTARGLDPRQLVLTDGQRTFSDPAELYAAAPSSLTAALGVVGIAPPLAGYVIAHTISHYRDTLRGGHAHAVAGVARQLGSVIAAAPADQRNELTSAAAALLADAVGDDEPTSCLELLAITVDEATETRTGDCPTKAQILQAVGSGATDAGTAQRVYDRLRDAAAALASTVDAEPGPAARSRHHRHRNEEDLHRAARHGSERER